MKVLLVRTGRRKQAITLGEFMFSEPIGLECVYTVLKEYHQVEILDLMAEEKDFLKELEAYKPDVVGITSLCVDVISVLELAAVTKAYNPKIVTLVGGTQAFLGPESFHNPNVDHVFVYTTRENLSKLFESLSNKEEIPLIDGVESREKGFMGTEKKGINEYIIPDRSSTQKYRHHYSYFGYKPAAIMETSMGCSSLCKFCLRWKIEGPCEKDRPLEEVMKQIEGIEEPTIMFYDNNFLYNKQRLEAFCTVIEEKGIEKNFICYGSAKSIVENGAPLMGRLRKAGLQAVLVGYESFKDEDLRSYKKENTASINLEAAKILRETSIDCWASFILHPDWDKGDFKKFRKYIKKLQPEVSTLVPMTPFPGGLLYKEYKDRLLFSKEAYDQWSFSVISIKPSKMSLRSYYWQFILTNLMINLNINSPLYLIRKFGFATIFKLVYGSSKFMWTYTKLMIKG